MQEDRKILKIFMAPEFFFRGRYGAYADISWNSEILEKMRVETGKDQYDPWLFIHGSALFATENMVDNLRKGLLLENFALVQKGGPKAFEHQDFVVQKEFPSHVDFQQRVNFTTPRELIEWYSRRRVMLTGEEETLVTPEGSRKDTVTMRLAEAKLKPQSELVGGSLFTMDGITFGLEVCRDHALGRLAHSPEGGKVQIQLIPSCGMNIENDSVGGVTGGIVFNVDGGAQLHVEVRKKPGVNNLAATISALSGGGTIRLFNPLEIPWPEVVSLKVANYLGLGQYPLSGHT